MNLTISKSGLTIPTKIKQHSQETKWGKVTLRREARILSIAIGFLLALGLLVAPDLAFGQQSPSVRNTPRATPDADTINGTASPVEFFQLVSQPAVAIDGSLRTSQASLQCVKQTVEGAPKYRIARTERTVSGPPTLIVYMSIDPHYFNQQDMTLLARQLNQDFCKEPRLSVLIFSDFRAAQSLVFSIERPPTYQRDYAALRGGYNLDRATGQEYVSFSLDAKKPHDEIRIVLGSSQPEALAGPMSPNTGFDRNPSKTFATEEMRPALLLVSSSTGPKEYRYRVRGRVVDQNGQPVAHAIVVVDAGLPKTWEDFTYSVESDENGRFLFQEPEATTDPHLTRLLYVTGPVPQKSHSPIMPPFNRIPRLTESRFASRPIRIKKNGEVNVGDVSIQVSYRVVDLHLQDVNGHPLITNEKGWKYVWLRIRNQQHKIVTYGSFSESDIENSVSLVNSSARIALPEGTWVIEASLREDKGPWLTSATPIHIDRSNKEIDLTLRQAQRSSRGPILKRPEQESKIRIP